jgi:hypothetical protein
MKYSEAYDKIIQAYFKDEIKPWDASFCFCGNLCDKSNSWYLKSGYENNNHVSHGYKGKELHRMERALLDTLYSLKIFAGTPTNTPSFENGLFKGMSAALDELKQIHIERGEVIDETPAFNKRQLQTV